MQRGFGWLTGCLVFGAALAACGADSLEVAGNSDASLSDDAAAAEIQGDGAGAASDAIVVTQDTGTGGGGVDGQAADTATGLGSPCKSDKECIGFDLVCDKAAGACVACNTNVDCQAPDTCKAHFCVPPPKACGSSKDCAELGQVCDKSLGHCVDCVTADDCGAGKICQSTVCVEPLCTPAEVRCKDDATLEICSANGNAWSPTPCAEGQTCEGGACKGSAGECSKGSMQCADAVTLKSCDETGTWQSTICPQQTWCISNASGAICGVSDCKPGSLLCQGDKVIECNAAGEMGDVSDDCSASGKICESGVCKEKQAGGLCTPGATVCQGSKLATCDGAGGAWTVAACAAGSACSDGSCKPVVCTPAAKRCEGKQLLICNAVGTAESVVEDCGGKGLYCFGGACSKQICTPGSVVCEGNVVATCNATGDAFATAACDDGDACSKNTCKAGACDFSQPMCDDGDPCTTDTCDTITGACSVIATGGPCDDGDACTLVTECTVQGCKPAAAGQVSTLAGSGGTGSQDGAGSSASFSGTVSGVLAHNGAVYVADAGNHSVRKVAVDGTVSTWAGKSGVSGFVDGALADARFHTPHGLAALSDGSIVVVDSGNRRIRRISAQGTVALWAGSGGSGSTDGPGTSASFTVPYGVAESANGGVYVTDTATHRIREILADGTVSTLAGSSAGFVDGPLAGAKLKNPEGIARAPGGAWIVCDSGNYRVRRIANGVIQTLAGTGSPGANDGLGSSASFGTSLGGVAVEASGAVVIVDSANHRLRRISPAGTVSTLVGASGGFADGPAAGAKLSTPVAISRQLDGRLIVSDRGNRRIRAMDPAVIDCDDGKGCTADSCDPKTGSCKNTPIGSGGACEDGDPCTVGETCDAVGSCSGGKAKACDDGDACTTDACNTVQGGCVATPKVAPVSVSLAGKHDVIFWIDTSGSMAQEAKYLNDQLNNFQKVVPKEADVNVVLIGNGFGICVQPPMGGTNCTDGPKFHHVKQTIGSTNGPNILAQNAAKWTPFLRPGATQHIVAVTDDNQSQPSPCSTACSTANGGQLGSNCSDCKAKWLFDELAKLAPALFAPKANQPYGLVHHSIVAYESKADCPTIAQKGAAYLRMSELTGGLKMKVCDTNWAPFFQQLGALFQTVAGDCAFAQPTPPAGAGSSGQFVVRVHSATGTKVLQPAPNGVCSGDGFSTKSDAGKTIVTLCPQSCQAAQAGTLDVIYSCQ
ncbi:MAG: hypothetical protein H6747_04770 [Deltaproteobacteria bacterium]|nr:hypothetical protein [Deltaproteobacteria bacterium]